MSTLDAIVARQRAEVALRMERLPYFQLRGMTSPTSRRFGEALRKPGPSFILECKKASPSEGLIRKNFDMAEIAVAYRHTADAVSVLIDGPYFQGSFEHLRQAREALSQPLLAKCFVTCPYQVCEARFHGADAVLLMLSVLDNVIYGECAAEVKRLGMDALTEVHDEAELERALALGAEVIGVNNRDLKTLKVDMGAFARLAGKIPPGKTVVCESGIGSRQDVLRILNAGFHADAFLVGTLLMKAERIDLAARRLIYGGVKICGLTSPKDAVKAYQSGASFGGVIFAEESPRRVSEVAAWEIRQASPLPLAGVFVNQESSDVARIASSLGLAAVQLHGEESEDAVVALRDRLPESCEIWKAVRVEGGNNGKSISAGRADRVLLDSFDKSVRGGTGRRFDWTLLEGDKTRTILAGGIDANCAFQAASLGCFAIDVNSGVEDAPGKKNHKKIERLFENIRGKF
ncbi:MAG: bifunctional indole-3-glycerol-phosphate synthase TrpC/phosphoribosylanthranilate isomerase TrpF [Synergistaceae bacterium]|jgi:indole-3-glycerol phosphate synthase/phosphoribosylanthranilate isomerase|nr:bifunctional indole-3-glycerol-phosphate synthase TrpC/phosphoribosylanthranilate isomerase TrpF [Synergistaceae bacterium]